jgi:hypothetical protein
MAQTYGNLGSFYQSQQAADHLVDILDSVEAANAHLDQIVLSLCDPAVPG